jgi:hypothetical protein
VEVKKFNGSFLGLLAFISHPALRAAGHMPGYSQAFPLK